MNDATQTGFAMAAIGLAGTIAGLFFGWLKDRDKLKFGDEVTALKAQNTVQAGQIAAQELKITSLTAIQAACEQRHKECEEKHKTTETRIADIERSLEAKKDKTSDHEPLK